ncbi:MAG: phosphoenolpyruvate carboxykinase (ATP), partial [Lutispora sp.]
MNRLHASMDGEEIQCSKIHYNLPIGQLISIAVEKENGYIAKNGALCGNTGKYTGRSPNDRFIVDSPSVHQHINWNKANLPMTMENFDRLYSKVLDYIKGKEVFAFEGFAGADKEYRMPVRVINEFAFQNLFAQQMLIKAKTEELNDFNPGFTIIAVPDFKADPKVDMTNSEAFIVLNFEKNIVLIGGTKYCGEI